MYATNFAYTNDIATTANLEPVHLYYQQQSLLNRLRTGQGHCGMCREKWGLTLK